MGEKSVVFPEMYTRRQLNSLYREIPLTDRDFRLLRKYFNAAANLYGVIPVWRVLEIIQVQNPHHFTQSQLLEFVKIARHECEDYYILGEDELYTDGKATDLTHMEIIDVLLVQGSLEAYSDVRSMQRGKSYYVPQKEILLKYDDMLYCEPTEQAAALKAYIHRKFEGNPEAAEELFGKILLNARDVAVSPFKMLDYVKEAGLSFHGETDLNGFIQLYQDFHNNLRMQGNCGHTPAEISAMYKPGDRVPTTVSFGQNVRRGLQEGTLDIHELRQQILTMNVPNEDLRFNLLKELSDIEAEAPSVQKKPGRNDPCPCGSGKKYKKCCGRNI